MCHVTKETRHHLVIISIRVETYRNIVCCSGLSRVTRLDDVIISSRVTIATQERLVISPVIYPYES